MRASDHTSRLSPVAVNPAPSCYRVLMRDGAGTMWAPVIVAASDAMAETRAQDIFAEREVLGSVLVHSIDAVHVNLPQRERTA